MNREIKFRGKVKYNGNHKFNGEWIYGYYRNNDIGNAFITETLDEIENYIFEETEVEEETIGQYTGLHDKNGKEIYEGDIVKRTLIDKKDNRVFFEDTYQIIFERGTFKYKGIKEFYINIKGEKYKEENKSSYKQELGSNFGVNIESIEVIGNIYDNPELLEV